MALYILSLATIEEKESKISSSFVWQCFAKNIKSTLLLPFPGPAAAPY